MFSKPEICKDKERNQVDPEGVQHYQVDPQRVHQKIQTAADKWSKSNVKNLLSESESIASLLKL